MLMYLVDYSDLFAQHSLKGLDGTQNTSKLSPTHIRATLQGRTLRFDHEHAPASLVPIGPRNYLRLVVNTNVVGCVFI